MAYINFFGPPTDPCERLFLGVDMQYCVRDANDT
jgi:hypothetical protein